VPHRGAEIPRNAATVRRLHCYSGMIEAVCWRLRVRVFESRPAEICRHFTGQGSWGGRDKKKAATVRTCLTFGWDVAGQVDAADALALWCFAEAVLDPVAAAQRRARLGLELALHPPNEDAPLRLTAGRQGSSVRHKKGELSNGRKSNTDPTGQLQLAAG